MYRGEKLGEGTYGMVYKAHSPTSQREYAVKRNLSEEEIFGIGCLRELDILSKTRGHLHLVHTAYVVQGNPFRNGCLSPLQGSDRIQQRDDKLHFIFEKAPYDLHSFIYSPDEPNFLLMKRYMVHILLAVENLHGTKIIHRDLKPNNILVFPDSKDMAGNMGLVKICDFGLAKPFTMQGIQTPNVVTSWYRAPEICLGWPNYDYKADMWSVGCIFFEMVSRNAFLSRVPEDNDVILSRILGILPQPLSQDEYTRMIDGNPKQMKIGPSARPRRRRTFANQIGLSKSGAESFSKQAGSFDLFCDLLCHLFTFDPSKRWSAIQALHHPFFDDYQPLILQTRMAYPMPMEREQPFIITDCIERSWGMQVAFTVFNNRSALNWYSDRALFQAMDLYDRYISVIALVKKDASIVESEERGQIHSRFEAELRFVVCLYACIKYFSSVQTPVPFEAVASEQFRTPEALIEAERFECDFVRFCLEYNIYRPTLYEVADRFGDYLQDQSIRDLLMLYGMTTDFSGLTPSELYARYRNLGIEELLGNDVLPSDNDCEPEEPDVEPSER